MRNPSALPAMALLASCGLYAPDPGPGGGLPDPRQAQVEKFRSLVDSFLEWFYASRPDKATAAGIHAHDRTLGRWSREDLTGQAAALRHYLRRLSQIDRELLPDEEYHDSRILDGRMRAELLQRETLRPWERNPDIYRRIISEGLYSLAARAFDTPERRMELAAGRLRDVPVVLDRARENLSHPPRLFTEVALEGFGGTHRFLKQGLPEAFAAVRDESVRQRFTEAQGPALAATGRFMDWMRRDLLGRSDGRYSIGPEDFRARLLYEEGIETPVEDLLRRGYELLKRTQEAMAEASGGRPVRAALGEAARDHPPADRLLEETRSMLADLKAWSAGLVEIPAGAECLVQETPEFRRSLSFASMDVPGPFEEVARESYYSITPPDPAWPPDRRAQHLSFFNRAALRLISAHEVYPGHYTQLLAARRFPSKVRRAFPSAAFVEGWAHYCEQLYVEETGAASALRLQQLSLALLRICRAVVALEMHTGGMTVEQAMEFFANEGYLDRANAEREARRGAMDPLVLVYTLGKHEILALREEMLRRREETLRGFHDALLSHGAPPLPVLRAILLGHRPRG